MSEDRYNEFVAKMEEKYPHMFSNVYCGISINEGWFHIIESLCANIDSHVKWKRERRAYDLRLNRARNKGRDAVLKFICKGKSPTTWDEERADDVMESTKDITPYVRHVSIHQIKEKFGGLRFYYDGGDDRVFGMVTMAEAWANATCETCGERGTRRNGGWVRTLCDKHEEEYQKRKNENV